MIIAVPAVVAVASILLMLVQPPRYTSTGVVMISQAPHTEEQVVPFPDLNLIHSWQSSEYILDDVTQVVESAALAQDILTWLEEQGYDIDDPELEPKDIQESLEGEKIHRSIEITSEAGDPILAEKVIEGAMVNLKDKGLAYWNRPALQGNGLSVAVLTPATEAEPVLGLSGIAINLVLRVGLALVAAMGLAFLLHYLDDRLREPHHVEEWTGMRVVGVIPNE